MAPKLPLNAEELLVACRNSSPLERSTPIEQFVLGLSQPDRWLPWYVHRSEEGPRSLTVFIGHDSHAVETTNDLNISAGIVNVNVIPDEDFKRAAASNVRHD